MKRPATTSSRTIELRILVTGSVRGCAYALQRGRDEIEQIHVATEADLCFELPVTVSQAADGTWDAKGPHVQGPRGARFVYITSGTRAGQASVWNRRAKIPLSGLYAAASSSAAARFEARIAGTARDLGPACASVPLLGAGWRRL